MDTFLIWVCSDCIQHAANGECGQCDDDSHDRPPLGLLEGKDATMGMMADEHHEDCDYRNSRAARDTEEAMNLPERTEVHDCNLDCENTEFSWSHCEGCGSTLGGSRHAMTIHESKD